MFEIQRPNDMPFTLANTFKSFSKFSNCESMERFLVKCDLNHKHNVRDLWPTFCINFHRIYEKCSFRSLQHIFSKILKWTNIVFRIELYVHCTFHYSIARKKPITKFTIQWVNLNENDGGINTMFIIHALHLLHVNLHFLFIIYLKSNTTFFQLR